MITRSFGILSDGRKAGLYILRNRKGMEAHVTDYGAAIVRLIIPDKNGERRDVVLGYDDAAAYEQGHSSFGATVGRVANRISGAAFDLNGRHYILTANNGPNTLHGGRDFYAHRLWSAVIPFGKVSTGDIAATYAVESMNDWSRERRGREANGINTVSEMAADDFIVQAGLIDGDEAKADHPKEKQTETGRKPALSRYTTELGWTRESFEQYAEKGKAEMSDSITFALDSPDGDQGFPGNIHIEVTYTLTYEGELHIDYRASFNPDSNPKLFRAETFSSGKTVTDAADRISTPLNLTNHSYFNLNGHDSGTVLTHEVQIDAEWFTETDRRSIPTGSVLEVRWTPMDFRKPKTLGRDIYKDYEPLKYGNGYDHNYVLSDAQTDYRKVASMYADDSGIRMDILTDLPGVQLYTANGLDEEPGKDGAVYRQRSAACFETQFWPDTINKPHFPGGVLTEGDTFSSRTTYKFSTEN